MKSLTINLALIILFLSSPLFTSAALGENAAAQPDGQMKFISIPFAFGYMIDMSEDTTEAKPWWVRLKVGAQHDDNVIMTAKEAPLPPDVPKKDDWRLIANLNAKYMFYKSRRFETAASYALFQSLHDDLHDFNVTQNMAELYGQYSIMPFLDFKATYTVHHMLLGGDTYDTARMGGARFIVRESAALITHIDYNLRNTDYKDVSIFEYNSERTGENRLAGITQYVVFPAAPAMLRIGYSDDEEKTRQDYLDYRGDKILIGTSVMPSERLLLDFYWEYNKRDYKAISPYTDVKRKDTTSVIAFTATQYITENYGLNLRLFYMQNNSNLAQFDVTRFVPSLMLDMRF